MLFIFCSGVTEETRAGIVTIMASPKGSEGNFIFRVGGYHPHIDRKLTDKLRNDALRDEPALILYIDRTVGDDYKYYPMRLARVTSIRFSRGTAFNYSDYDSDFLDDPYSLVKISVNFEHCVEPKDFNALQNFLVENLSSAGLPASNGGYFTLLGDFPTGELLTVGTSSWKRAVQFVNTSKDFVESSRSSYLFASLETISLPTETGRDVVVMMKGHNFSDSRRCIAFGADSFNTEHYYIDPSSDFDRTRRICLPEIHGKLAIDIRERGSPVPIFIGQL